MSLVVVAIGISHIEPLELPELQKLRAKEIHKRKCSAYISRPFCKAKGIQQKSPQTQISLDKPWKNTNKKQHIEHHLEQNDTLSAEESPLRIRQCKLLLRRKVPVNRDKVVG